MRTMTIVGIVVLVLGIVTLALGGFTTTRVETDKVGPLSIERQHTETHLVPPVVSWLAVGVGAALVIAGLASSRKV